MTRESWPETDAYLAEMLIAADPVLDAVLAANAAAGLPAADVSPLQGKFLNLLARALPSGGCVVTLEANALHARTARENFVRAGLRDQIDLREGAALDTLAALHAEAGAPFDFVFIDADKPNNSNYLDWTLKLTRPGSAIVADNVVRAGAVTDAASTDASVKGVRAFLDKAGRDPRLSLTALQTVGVKGWDGFALALVR